MSKKMCVIIIAIAIIAFGVYSVINAGKTGFWLFGGTYVGERKGGEPHGYGVHDYAQKKYVGEWKEGKHHGWGVWESPGGFYFGEWKEDRPYGFGISDREGGPYSLYEIFCCDDQGLLNDGERFLMITEGDDFNIYIGDFEDGGLQGYGVWVNYGGDMYVGQWKDGQLHGLGTYVHANGEVESGQWGAGRYLGP